MCQTKDNKSFPPPPPWLSDSRPGCLTRAILVGWLAPPWLADSRHPGWLTRAFWLADSRLLVGWLAPPVGWLAPSCWLTRTFLLADSGWLTRSPVGWHGLRPCLKMRLPAKGLLVNCKGLQYEGTPARTQATVASALLSFHFSSTEEAFLQFWHGPWRWEHINMISEILWKNRTKNSDHWAFRLDSLSSRVLGKKQLPTMAAWVWAWICACSTPTYPNKVRPRLSYMMNAWRSTVCNVNWFHMYLTSFDCISQWSQGTAVLPSLWPKPSNQAWKDTRSRKVHPFETMKPIIDVKICQGMSRLLRPRLASQPRQLITAQARASNQFRIRICRWFCQQLQHSMNSAL